MYVSITGYCFIFYLSSKKKTHKYKPSPCGTGEDELHTGERPGQRDTLGDYRKCGELKDLAEIMDRKR